MKKLIQTSIIVLAAAIGLSSCSKKSDNSVSPSGGAGSWNISGTKYTATTTVFTNNSLLSLQQSANGTSDGFTIDFHSTPSAGTYSVAKSYTTYGSNQCTIESNAGSMSYTSAGGGSVTISVSGGKISATFSGIALNSLNASSNTTATATVSGTLTQQ